jgi:hypothetical protein
MPGAGAGTNAFTRSANATAPAHLLYALHEYERHHNLHRPHRGISDTRPMRPLPEPITDPARITHLHIRRRDRLGGHLHEYGHAA